MIIKCTNVVIIVPLNSGFHAMKACLCRNVSDHTVKQVLADFFKGIIVITKRRGDNEHETQQPNNLDDLHEACSDGQGFNCGSCACYIAELATEHNHNVRLNELKENLPEQLLPTSAQTPEKPATKLKTEPA